ncbi:MAG TPA: SDR family oxidoreductase [Blastocatellia bacterium]|nr:SDR family oxidoreductase [Blastocatellia bacterium]
MLCGLMKNKVCVVTGANSGIGKETAVALAAKGATVVIVTRDAQKGAAAVADIVSRSGNTSVSFLAADLSSQAAIRTLAEEINAKLPRIDVLVNNAGAIIGERKLTVDGIETTFAVNHLGYFLLTHLLLDKLKASAPARIVNVASDAHRSGTINFDDLGGEKNYGSWAAYCQSKLANVMFTYELARRLEGSGVTANSLHPGVVATGFGKSGSGLMKFAVTVIRPFLISSAKGAETTIYLASSPEVEGVSGKYFDKCRAVSSTAASNDPAAARRLWEISEKLTGIA